MKIIDEGLFIKLLPNDGMVLTDVATETMRAEEIDLGKDDSADNYKDIPKDTPIPEPTGDLTVNDTLEMPTQEEDDEFQEILDYYIDGIKKGYISNNDIPLKYRDKIVEYLK